MYLREDPFITTWSLACLQRFLIAQIFLKCLIIASLLCEALVPCYRQASDRILPFKPNPTGFNATPCPANHHHLQSAQRNLLSYRGNRISSYSLWEDSRCQKALLNTALKDVLTPKCNYSLHNPLSINLIRLS
jgi:hypothetical protein